jgi:RNAse (barnase) inhibitor barstar
MRGGVILYWADRVLAEDLAWLRQERYVIHEFDGSKWRAEDDLYKDVAKALGYSGYFGRNLAAFSDCMLDVEVPDDGGMVILIRDIDAVERHDQQFLWDLLDILDHTTRRNLLFGRRLLTLLQSRNSARTPAIDFSGVGAVHVTWNPREWLNSTRGL